MESRFKIGDKVDFVNDYGVKFENLIITGIDEDYKDEVRYFLAPLEPSFEKWHHSYEEKNLHEAGTEVKVESDLELNNGSIAVFQKYNDNYNKIFEIDYNGNKITSVLVDGSLHTINDYDEPMNALAPLFQPVSINYNLENLDKDMNEIKQLVEEHQKEIKPINLTQK